MNRHPYQTNSNRNAPGRCIPMTLAAVVMMLATGAARADNATEMPWGYDTPAGRCVVCHSLEKNGPFRVAPNLYGIVGAEKARDRQWYAYSPALIEAGGTWTPADIDAYLANANGFMPGTTKSIRVSDPEERAEIINFLEELNDRGAE